MKQHLLLFLGVIAVSAIAIVPLFQPGFFPIHDNTQITRVHEMHIALRDGMLPVRWVPDLGYGYGYPIYTFYAPFAYYVGGLLQLLGFSALVATKLMIGIGMILAGVTMYLLAQQLMRKEAAVLAAVLYVFAPYHGVNLYVRGAVAEIWAYAFLPLAFYGLLRVVRDRTWASAVIGGIGLAGVILSHNLTAYMLIPFYGVYVLYLLYQAIKKRHRLTIGLIFATVSLGLLFSGFYWLPALAEMKYTNVASQITGGSRYMDHYVCPIQLWAGVRGFGGSAPGCLDGLSFQIGKIHILLAAIALFIMVLFYKKAKTGLLLFVGGLVAVFMVLPVSRFVWDTLPRIAYVQFPWRYLSFVSLFFSLVGAVGLSLLFEKYFPKRSIIAWGIISIIGLGSIVFYNRDFQPQQQLTDLPPETEPAYIRWEVSKISDEYLPASFLKPKNRQGTAASLIEGEGISVIRLQEKTQQFLVTVRASDEAEVVINKAVFPAWNFRLNGARITPKEQNGRYIIPVSEGESEIAGLYQETPVERIGTVLSIISIITSVIGIILWRQYYKTERKTS